ncbi:flagellar basal body P-ring formation chaperone FlgA [Spartinivicinus poritis]|uniref:Flagella basal body P-ring formation protein FlgA n=1 Tax=Spartinivicinus poritis TaxID=2994640 RepID=A0ABT5U417_9GAMM|nr:flagellar basal body P-ring formation chaperone FlgA [Spartinivicinus sp. A2-2]MDE1461057.1 flagellar basal body P-ring formation chaperone FlgA [Spartinivicinus sp. A2-2]
MNIHSAIMRSLLAFGLAVTTMASWSNPVHRSIQQLLYGYLENQLKTYTQQLGSGRYEIHISAIDPRLKLQPCANKLTIEPSQRRQHLIGRATHKIKCLQSPYWSLYVATQVKLYRQVIAASRTLQKGHVITSNDLIQLEQDISKLRGSYFPEPSKLLGKVVTRQIKMGQPITQNHITQALAIKKGTQVAIHANTSNFSVLAKGIALSDGKPGQLIKVRNIRSKRVIQAVVKDAYTVEATL